MIQKSWKIGGLALLAYVISMCFLVPLGPGLLEFQDAQSAGVVANLDRKVSVYRLVGLNTHWDEQPESLHVYLKHKSALIELPVVEVADATHADVGLVLPDTLPSKSWDVFASHPSDGTLLLENGLFFENSIIHEEATWPTPVVSEYPPSLAFHFPFQPRIFETIRNLMLHVPMWFTMFLLMGIGFVASIRQLSSTQSTQHDLRAESSVQVGMVFGVLGLITGSLWARFTWGAWWVDDPQLNGAMVTVLVYAGYLILRATVENQRLKARLSAVYNLFAFVILIILLMVLPRFTESLHPGKGGNPGFNSYDLDSSLRMVFYPAVIGWMLLGLWMYRVRLATAALNQKLQQL